MSHWTWEYVPDYRDDVVLVVRVQHYELSDPAG